MSDKIERLRQRLSDEDRALFDEQLEDLKQEGAAIEEFIEEWIDREDGVL